MIIADPDFPQDKAVELVDLCHQRGVTVQVAPSTMEILIDRAEFVPGHTVPLFTLRPPVFEGVDYALKRTFDLVLSVVGLIVLSPVLLAIALAIKLSSRGPVIYRSVRPGMAGKPFFCFKFRTMREHAEQIQDELEPLNELVGRAVQDPRRPADDEDRAVPASLLARRAAPARQRGARRDVTRRAAAAADARLRPTRGVAQEALPGAARASPACGRSRGEPSSTSTTSSVWTSCTSSGGRSCSTSRSC